MPARHARHLPAGRGGEAAAGRVRRPSGGRRPAGRRQRHRGLDLLHRHRHPGPRVAPPVIESGHRVGSSSSGRRGSCRARARHRSDARTSGSDLGVVDVPPFSAGPAVRSSARAAPSSSTGMAPARAADAMAHPGVLDAHVVLGTDPRRPPELPEHAQPDQPLEFLGRPRPGAVVDALRRLGLVEGLLLPGSGPQQDAQADAPAEQLVAVHVERPRPGAHVSIVPL